MPLSNLVPRGFGFVHHSIAILYHEVPNPNLTIRNFFIAVRWRTRGARTTRRWRRSNTTCPWRCRRCTTRWTSTRCLRLCLCLPPPPPPPPRRLRRARREQVRLSECAGLPWVVGSLQTSLQTSRDTPFGVSAPPEEHSLARSTIADGVGRFERREERWESVARPCRD